MKRRVPFAICTLLLAVSPLTHAQTRPGTGSTIIDSRPRGSYSIRGNVRFATNERPAEMVKIELRRFSGDMAGTAITRSNGEFEFSGLAPGTYYLVIDESGYEAVRDSVEVITSSLYGVNVYLKKPGELPTAKESGSSVSVRELSLPRDTRETFRKALDVLYTKRDTKAAIPMLLKVIAAAPAFYEAEFHLGVAYNEINQLTEAEAAYRKAMELSEEKYPPAMIALASLLTTAQKAADAEPLARCAVALDTTLWQGHYELGRALMDLNKVAEAEQNIAETIKLRPDYPPAYLLLANIHIRTKNHTALLAALNEYLRLEPDGPQSAQARKIRDTVQQSLEKAKTTPASASPKP